MIIEKSEGSMELVLGGLSGTPNRGLSHLEIYNSNDEISNYFIRST